MKAAVYQGDQRIVVEDFPIPDPGPNEILVRIQYSAICGTDVHAFLYDIAPPGSVLGHEFSGVVEKIGSSVKTWSQGDRVIGGGGTPPPGLEAPLRRQDQYNYRTEGFTSTRKRGYSEFTVLNDWEPLKIPENVTDLQACLTEPCAVVVRAVRLSNLRLGDTAVVIGAGPIGLLCMQAVKAAGARKVIVVEPVEARRNVALHLGADAVIDPTIEDVNEAAILLTDGSGPHVVFECAAAKSTLETAFRIVRKKGNVMLVALAWDEVPLVPVDWAGKELSFNTTFGSEHYDWITALSLIESGKVSLDPLMSDADIIGLEDIQKAFEGLCEPSTQVQVIIDLNEPSTV